jgi:DNA-binding transcriptional ArsR family regulator
MNQVANIDDVMRALADPTRRASGVTQGAVSQHLRSLKRAGLVAERPQGRNVYYRAKPEGLAPLFDWLSHYDAFWRERLANLRTLLKEIDP